MKTSLQVLLIITFIAGGLWLSQTISIQEVMLIFSWWQGCTAASALPAWATILKDIPASKADCMKVKSSQTFSRVVNPLMHFGQKTLHTLSEQTEGRWERAASESSLQG